jgi:hypothetical protein
LRLGLFLKDATVDLQNYVAAVVAVASSPHYNDQEIFVCLMEKSQQNINS